MQGSAPKITAAFQTFRRWAQEKGLEPTETPYVMENKAVNSTGAR
jgi:DNA gyrase inhibitor GyrI